MVGTKEEKYYIKIRKKISDWLDDNSSLNYKWKEYILLAPDIFYLLANLVQDPDVPQSKKIKLIAVIAYFISPFDIVPEAILGPIGYLDDIAISAYIVNELLNTIDAQIIKRNWAGDVDILYVIKNIIVNIDKMLSKGVWDKIKNFIK